MFIEKIFFNNKYERGMLSDKKVVVVLGAGRCGTSLLMQLLAAFGLPVSKNMIPPKSHNPLGPMEDADLANVYDNMILKAVHSNRALPFPSRNITTKLEEEIFWAFKKILLKNISSSSSGTIWGFKDPITTFLLPIWLRVFDELDISPIFVVAVRNPAHSAVSKKNNFSIPESLAELSWANNYIDAILHTSAKCFFVQYEDWFTRPLDQALALINYTGIDVSFSRNIEDVLSSLIKPELNRSLKNEYEVGTKVVSDLYRIIKECRGDKFDADELIRSATAFHVLMSNFQGWYTEAHRQIGRYYKLKDRLKKEQEKNKLLQSEIERKKVAINDIRNSFSYQLSQEIVQSFKKPGWHSLSLPYRVWDLYRKK